MTIPGGPLTLTVTFLDEDGAAFDPASGIAIWVQAPPDGTQTEYTYAASEVTRTATGVYAVTIDGSQAGRYIGQGVGVLSNGFKVSTEPETEDVEASPFPL